MIAGHSRILAAKLKIDEVPVVVARGWSEAQKRAYLLADNRLIENGTWDNDLLQAEIGALKDLNFTGASCLARASLDRARYAQSSVCRRCDLSSAGSRQ